MDKIIEHLRLISLTLLAVCFLLLVAAFSLRINKIDRAYKQLNEIKEVMNYWNENFLEDFATREFGLLTKEVHHLPAFWRILPSESRSQLTVRLNPPFTSMLPQPDTLKLFDKKHFYRTGSIKIPKLADFKLYDFIKLWDSLNIDVFFHVVYHIEPGARIYKSEPLRRLIHPGTKSLIKIEMFTTDKLTIADVNAKIEAIDSKALPRDFENFSKDPFTHVFVGECPSEQNGFNWVVMIPARAKKVTFNAQKALIVVHGKKWLQGNFEKSFPELSEVSKDYKEDVSIELLDRIIKSEVNRERPPLEIFGAKLPNAAIGIWGLTVVILIQIYFACHLQELSSRITNKNPISTPWLPLLQNNLPKILTIISFVILPFGVILSILIDNLQKEEGMMTLIYQLLLIIISFLFGIKICFLFKKIWHELSSFEDTQN